MPPIDHIARFAGTRVLVIGDLILDHYIRGEVTRTSPEAPVPIVAVRGEDWLPGGAANVAANLVALGARAELLGVVGDDEGGGQLGGLLEAHEGLRATLVRERGRPTTLKTRCMAQGQQMLRLDRETAAPVSAETRQRVIRAVNRLAPKCAGIIVSDYGKGLLVPEVLEAVFAAARAAGLAVVVDPKGRDYRRYRGASVITPNQKEASEESAIAVVDDSSAAEAARELRRSTQAAAVVITRGAAGISVFPRRGTARHIPTRARAVFDVTGAGDTVIATLGLALFCGADVAEAAYLGNAAAGIVVGLAGVATVSAERLRLECQEDQAGPPRKLVTAPELLHIVRSLRQNGRRLVFTNGFFDLLHHGHVRLLDQARELGDCLVVALNSDESTRRLKGAPRPILQGRERAELLSALPSVDYLVFFDEDTPVRLLEQLRPEVLVKGAPPGATIEDVVGHELVREYGGEVRLVPVSDGPRISALLERAQRPTSPPKRKAKM